MKEIAVVILNWNGEALLKKFLPGVVAHSELAEVYVADNASTDASVTMLKREFPNVKIIQNSENLGYAGGYNLSLQHIKEKYAVLLNSDVKVTEGWLSPILDLFRSNKGIAAIQPKILDFKDPQKFEYAGAGGGFLDKYGYAFCRGRIFQELEEDHGQYNDRTPIFWASGACIAVDMAKFNEIGGFDTDFFAHQEEIDLCWRFQNHNYSVFYEGKSSVYHVGGATLNSMNPRKTFLNFRNNLFLLLKNLPKQKLFGIILGRMILDGVAAFKFLFEGKFNHFFAVFRAHLDFYKKFKKMFQKRSKTLKINKYYFLKSIVTAHFIEKKNKFSSL